MLTALYLKAVPPTITATPSFDQTQRQPPFPWCSSSSPVPRGNGEPGLTERGWETVSVTVGEQDRKRETSASHLDGKIPPILEIRT